MKQCYTSKKCANRGPHKVNHRSYVGPYIAPRIGPTVEAPISEIVEVLDLPWYVKLWQKMFNFFKNVCALFSSDSSYHRKDCQSASGCS